MGDNAAAAGCAASDDLRIVRPVDSFNTLDSNGSPAHVAHALRRLETALARNPDFGHVTRCSTTVTTSGIACTTVEGDHRIDTDLPAALGGSATAASPSALLRAALGSCLAIGYRLRAARLGVPIGAIRVVVETDSAIAGMLLADARARPGFSEIRCHVEIESDADEADVRRVVAAADQLSPVLDALAADSVQRSLTIVGGGT